MKYYHCSNKVWRVGDVITAQPHREYSGGAGIYVTTSPEPHFTLLDNGGNSLYKGMRVYRVRPLGKVRKGHWGDFVCQIGVEVVESLGEVAKSGKFSSVHNSGETQICNIKLVYDPKVEAFNKHKKQNNNKPRYFVKTISAKKEHKENQKGFKSLEKAIQYREKLNPVIFGIFDRVLDDWVEGYGITVLYCIKGYR